jgi:hypothetical protein
LRPEPTKPGLYRVWIIAFVLIWYSAFKLSEGAPTIVHSALVLLLLAVTAFGAFKGFAQRNTRGYLVGAGLSLLALAAGITIWNAVSSDRPVSLGMTSTPVSAMFLLGAVLLLAGELMGLRDVRKTGP